MNLIEEDGSLSKETARLYKSFMQSYVTRINDATFRVPIAGIRIGSAKYSRLAQINLKTRIITFSRFAIENVPERGRRYLVLHELAHVLEASHNKTFWHLVGQFEPEYKDIGVSLDRAFKQNVESHEKTLRSLKRKARSNGGSPAQNQQQLKLYNSHGGQTPQSIIWTPNHGYVEPGSQRFGLHRDPKELFFKAGESQAEETYAAYLDLDLEEEAEQEPTQTSCIFDASSEVDKAQDLYVYEDEGDFDLFYGTMSGGDY
ncbi:MAG: M48 family metallopeptidase [Cyanobacteria bacterium SZAS LIN-3]|nr:M48 family metallopeptidase [Cyanobacteria bacterium SZAS LIN-3]MBS2006451.1 M48 family metallopeptidase [Cyanobacteria bacterium SZAS TMP-1]